MSSDVAGRLLAKHDSQLDSAGAIPGARAGQDMPSSVMHRPDLKVYTDIRRQRQQHGRRIRVLAELNRLRHLIRACSDSGDRSGRVYAYLEQLNQLYMQQLCGQTPRPVLQLRSGGCITMEATEARGSRRVTVVVVAYNGRTQLPKHPVSFDGDNATSPLFNRALYAKDEQHDADRKAADAIDPCAPCWVDYLVNDLSETDVHGLFALVVQSRVPEETQPRYRAAIEEALAFALNRAGRVLRPLESVRLCTYFVRRHRELWAHKMGVADKAFGRILALWRNVGQQCVAELRASDEGSRALGEIAFKRWNSVASQLIAWRAQHVSGVSEAWALVAEWHATWVQAMQLLCAERRRGFASGEDPYVCPFWRPKRPGRLRLRELTVSDNAICSVLHRLVQAGMPDRAAELLGLATSEAGVRPSVSMFNIALRGLSAPRRLAQPLPSLAGLPLVNQRAPQLYMPRGDCRSDSDIAHAQMMALVRGMEYWGLEPDRFTLHAMVRLCCVTGNRSQLKTVLQSLAVRWQLDLLPQSWSELQRHDLHFVARDWINEADQADE
ncbi:hypothetical protein H4R19_001858 [Coemansia spiralis]|nr:hypothetical protein H4R19_001858 [Coemansia spiralis]